MTRAGCQSALAGRLVRRRKNIAPELSGSRLHTRSGSAAWFVLCHQLHFRAVRLGRLREGQERWILIGDERPAVRSHGEVRLVSDEEEELFLGKHRAAHGERHVRRVIRIQFLRLRHAEFAARGKLLRGVVEAGNAMEVVGSRLAGHDGLDGTGAAVIDRIGVRLHADFGDRIRIGREIDDAGTDAAGHVHSIDHVLIAVRAASIGAGVDPVLGSKVGGVVGARRSLSAAARDAWRHDNHVGWIPSRERQRLQGCRVQGLLESAIGSIEQRSLSSRP